MKYELSFASIIYLLLSLFLLLYMVLPGPRKVEDFGGLPTSLKSDEPGDTVQVANIAAYYSQLFRKDVVKLYTAQYQNLNFLGFAPLRLNYPPEFAYEAIKDQTKSTYLEELVFPLRDSLFISGYEPHYEDGTPKFKGATDIIVDEVKYNTKATLRFFPSSIAVKLIIWIGINLSFLGLYHLSKKIFLHQ